MPPNVLSAPAPSRGIVSQPSISAQLMRAEVRAVGSEIWMEDERKVWVLVKVVSQGNTMLVVKHTNGKGEQQIDLGFEETYPHNPKVVSDMTALHHIHEAGLLYNLGQRAQLNNQRPYTFMGTILIAVNPLRKVPDPPMEKYKNQPLNPETPHPYAIAELAYHQMRLGAGRKAANQSIVVSGESGAGKTETSKIILRFLTDRSVGGVTTLEQRVVDSSPILESFGNAKTLRNNNSSRFGKFLKLQFTKDKYRLTGAFVETYLLEKSRVLSQGQGERNFHVLYELVAGAAEYGLAEELMLKGPEAYRILSESGCTTLQGVDDAAQFAEVRKACGTVGMDEETQMQVWRVLAAVLNMSNIAFEGVDHEQGEVASVKDRLALERLAELIGMEVGELEAMLTIREVKQGREVFSKQLDVQDAVRTRDAIVKALYEALFMWIVRMINESLGKGEESLPYIGVLDIFGFENFEHKNEFEQLLINFTNESLQDTFNQQVFNNELKLYEDEGIEVTVSACPDNTECLKMLTGKPNGVIPGLDNVCSEPKPSDMRYLEMLHKTYARHEHFPRTKPQDMRHCFSVKHYAGIVKYTVHGWVEVNMDLIPQAFGPALRSSTLKVLRELADKPGAAAAPAGRRAAEMVGKGSRQRNSTLVKPTVAKSFLCSMGELNATLGGTTCNFVRCIKPNAEMKCGLYDNKYVVEQLQCLGILQTCEVLKVGMPTRVTYSDLKEVLGEKTSEAEKLFKGEPETSLIAAILWAFEVPSEAFRLGRTRVFFRAGMISTLQRILNETGPEKAPWVLSRLQEALANRHKAKAAAEEVQAALAEAELAVKEANKTAATVLGDRSESDDDESLVKREPPSSVAGGVTEDDLKPLDLVVKNARKAGSTVPQIETMMEAAKKDKIGSHAEGAMARLVAGYRSTIDRINMANTKAAQVEASIAEVREADEATLLFRLGDLFRTLRSEARLARSMFEGTVEAAAKCQVEKTLELKHAAKAKALTVKSRAAEVSKLAGEAARSSERQQVSFGKAKAAAEEAKSAGTKALAAFSSFKKLLQKCTSEEEDARTALREAAEREEAERQKEELAAAQSALKVDLSESSEKPATAKSAREIADLPDIVDASPAPKDRKMFSAILSKNSMSRRYLETDDARTPVPSPSPQGSPQNPSLFREPSVGEPPTGPSVLQRSATERFNETMAEAPFEGHLMMQSKVMKRWRPRYFVLANGFLAFYDKKSLVGTKKNKAMALTSQSVVSPTNQANFFGVCTGPTKWIMLAKSNREMNAWISAINAQIYALFMREYRVPEDDYRSQGTTGQFFYRMAPDAKPHFTWIRAYPEIESPRTGDGVFAGEVIEVTQILTNKDVTFLRMANDRGWTTTHDVEAGTTLFTKVFGELVQDTRTHVVPLMAATPAVVLFGPSLESQETGEKLMPGERAKVVQRFTPAEAKGATFVRLAGDRGWLPIMNGSGIVGVQPMKR